MFGVMKMKWIEREYTKTKKVSLHNFILLKNKSRHIFVKSIVKTYCLVKKRRKSNTFMLSRAVLLVKRSGTKLKTLLENLRSHCMK